MGNTQSKCLETTDSKWENRLEWNKRIGSEQFQCLKNMSINRRRRGHLGRVRPDYEITDFIKFNGMAIQMKKTYYWTFIEI